MGRMTFITGGERRRRCSDEDRARILAVVEAPDALVTVAARREEVCTSLVYHWRRQRPGFAEVVDEPLPDQRRRRGTA